MGRRRGPEKDGRYEEEGRGGGAQRKMAGMKKGGGVVWEEMVR